MIAIDLTTYPTDNPVIKTHAVSPMVGTPRGIYLSF